MHALTEKDVRASFVNASLRERNAIPLPDGFADLDWNAIDYLGWRDPKLPQVGYIVVPVDDEPVGILLRETERKDSSPWAWPGNSCWAVSRNSGEFSRCSTLRQNDCVLFWFICGKLSSSSCKRCRELHTLS